MAKLQQFMHPSLMKSWDVLRSRLEDFWWVKRIHAVLFKKVLDEVVVLNSVWLDKVTL